MTSAPPLDLDALSLDELKKLVVQLLRRVAVLEEENQRLRAEVARLKGLPKRPKRQSGPGEQIGTSASEPKARPAPTQTAERPAHPAGDRGPDSGG
jgi:hypothetical protein